MAILESDSGSIEIADDVHALIVQLAADVARKRVMTMEPVALGPFTVDIGGPGVAYGTIRLKSGDQVVTTLNETRALALCEKSAPQVKVAAPTPTPRTPPFDVSSPQAMTTSPSELAHDAGSPPPTIFETEPPPLPSMGEERELKLSQEVGSRLASLILHAADGKGRIVSDKEIRMFRNWLDRFIEEGSGPEVVGAVEKILQAPETPPVLKARLIQMMVKSTLPGIQEVLAAALHERQLRLLLTDPRIRAGLKSFLDVLEE
ncbi:MAG: hypothetical protein AAB229_07375 [Candidatus Hydrogenedentota bacterium]